MKGSQMEDDEGKEEKEEKVWRLKPIAFQVNITPQMKKHCDSWNNPCPPTGP